MFEITNLCIDKYITLQSLANQFMIFSGCYEGVINYQAHHSITSHSVSLEDDV